MSISKSDLWIITIIVEQIKNARFSSVILINMISKIKHVEMLEFLEEIGKEIRIKIIVEIRR